MISSSSNDNQTEWPNGFPIRLTAQDLIWMLLKIDFSNRLTINKYFL